jgi:hypothetical protein
MASLLLLASLLFLASLLLLVPLLLLAPILLITYLLLLSFPPVRILHTCCCLASSAVPVVSYAAVNPLFLSLLFRLWSPCMLWLEFLLLLPSLLRLRPLLCPCRCWCPCCQLTAVVGSPAVAACRYALARLSYYRTGNFSAVGLSIIGPLTSENYQAVDYRTMESNYHRTIVYRNQEKTIDARLCS